MAITSIGTPTATAGTASPLTSAWGSGQNRAPGNVLVAVVTITATTSATATACSTTGWSNLVEVSSGSSNLARVAIWWKPATGSDAAPSFTSTLSGTVVAAVTLYELNGAQGYVINTSGTVAAQGASISTQTATTSGNVALTGEFGIAGFARERAATTGTVTATTYHLDTSNSGASATGKWASMSLASPAAGSASSAQVTYSSTATTSSGAGAVVVFGLALPGPVLPPLQQPPGVRLVWVRTGSPEATQLKVTPATPPPPVTLAPVYPLGQPVRARIPVNGPRGRPYWRPGAPVNNPTRGPVFRQATTPTRAHVPQNAPRGRHYRRIGVLTQVQPFVPATFYPLGHPVAAATRTWPPRRGHVLTDTAVGPNPSPFTTGPPFYPARQPARARIPVNGPRGRHYRRLGAPVNNPAGAVAPPMPGMQNRVAVVPAVIGWQGAQRSR